MAKASCVGLKRWYVCGLHRESNCSLARAMDRRIEPNALWYHYFVSISCFIRDSKALLLTSVTHVNSATSST